MKLGEDVFKANLAYLYKDGQFFQISSQNTDTTTSQGLNWRKGILQVKFTSYYGWVSETVDQNWNFYQTISQEDKKKNLLRPFCNSNHNPHSQPKYFLKYHRLVVLAE